MALTLAKSTDYGIDVLNAYVRIDEQSGGKNEIALRVRWYFSKEKCEEGCAWLQEEIASFTPSVADGADNFLKQGYQYLKSLPEFANAIDA